MNEIGYYGFHGTLIRNFEVGIECRIYDKRRVLETKINEIQIVEKKQDAFYWGNLTAKQVLGGLIHFEDIYVLYGQKVSETSLAVDVVLKATGRKEGEIIFSDITNKIFE